MKKLLGLIIPGLLGACSGGGGGGGGSDQLQQITILSPADGSEQVSIVSAVSWQDGNSETSYTIKLTSRLTSPFSDEIVVAADTGSYQFRAAELMPGLEYTWQIIGKDSTDKTVSESEQRTFTTAFYESGIHFGEATAAAGIDHIGPSYGASWGDFNGDNRADLWVGNHYTEPSLYINQGDGTFIDIADDVWPGPVEDTHGVVWHDIDNDGDEDLIELVGGVAGNNVWINNQTFLTNEAVEYGIANGGARSRTPLLFDYDDDADLDLLLTQLIGTDVYPVTMARNGSQFFDTTAATGAIFAESDYAQLADLNGDNRVEAIVHNSVFPLAIYDTSTIPFDDITAELNLPAQGGSTAVDTVIADFNGDLKNDIFMTKQSSNRDLVIVSPSEINVKLTANNNQVGLKFKSDQPITINGYFYFGSDVENLVNVGSASNTITALGGTINPDAPEEYQLVLDADDTAVQGAPTYTPGATEGQFVWFDTATNEWIIYYSRPSAEELNVVITTEGEFQDIEPLGFTANPTPSWPNYFLSVGSEYIESRRSSGLARGLPCNSVVGEDFDNDMDIDLYLTCSQPVANYPNVLLQNDGSGRFTLVSLAGGAEGSTVGRGDTVVSADYDDNGFVDVFVSNGEGRAPFHNGPHQLFNNIGNPNNWIAIDLQGRFSNNKGVGSIVTLEAGGVAQLRTQGAGMHRHSQNQQRIHFGLADNELIETITIRWPSGIEQVLEQVAVNQILSVVETSTTECGDGLDNDGDGDSDFPEDTNCSSWQGTE